MGRVFEKRGTLWLDYLDESGKRHRVATQYKPGDEHLAQSILDKYERMIEGRKREIARGNLKTFEAVAMEWLKKKEAKGHSLRGERYRMSKIILPAFGGKPIDSIKQIHVEEWLDRLRVTSSHMGGMLSPGSIRLLFVSIKAIFKFAIAKGLITYNPCSNVETPRQEDKDPMWRSSAIYSREEAEILFSDERLPSDAKIKNAIMFLAGLRYGEMIALTWDDYDPLAKPLGKLSITKSYDSAEKILRPTKTKVPRDVPVHPELAKILAEWKLGGYEDYCGLTPRRDRLIIPSIKSTFRKHTTDQQHFHKHLEMLGMRHRRQHDARRTFISLALADGAQPHVLKWVTHGVNHSRAVMDLYTTLPWETLCSSVAVLKLSRRENQVIALKAFGTNLAPSFDVVNIKNECEALEYIKDTSVSSDFDPQNKIVQDRLDGGTRIGCDVKTFDLIKVVPNGAKSENLVEKQLLKLLNIWRETKDVNRVLAAITNVRKRIYEFRRK